MSPLLDQQTRTPDRLVMATPGLTSIEARQVALEAVALARRDMPKLSGASASRLQPLYGPGFIGIRWPDPHVWYQEAGTSPWTMKRLAGKVVPMWIDDPTGKERDKNPKAKIRITASGKVQVLIFRRAGKRGEQKPGSTAHWPGQPGRVAYREMASPHTRKGRGGGRISKFNIGIWWRNPGLAPRGFLYNGLTEAAWNHGIVPGKIVATNQRWG